MNRAEVIKQDTMEKELIRKVLHMTVAFVPALVQMSLNLANLLLLSGILFYSLCEYMRLTGKNLLFITQLTSAAARKRDHGFVLGPVALALGALYTINLFSVIPLTVGIFALAFGDGLSSVTGKLWGSVKIPFTQGKSVVGSLTCFSATFIAAFTVTGSFSVSFIAAVTAMSVEMLPLKDFDNVLIPVCVAASVALAL